MRDVARCGRCKTAVSPLHKPLAIHSVAELDELVAHSPVPVLVDFWAQWCGPCLAVAPQLEQVADRKAGEAVIAKVDTEEIPELAERFGIRAIPTMIVFAEGREKKRMTGAMPADAIERGL
jgi:thioredoxin 2